MKKIFKVLIGILVITFIFSVVLFLFEGTKLKKSSNQSEVEKLKKDVSYLIIKNGDSVQQFKLELESEDTVFNLLQKSGVSFDYTKYKTGIFIDSIKGIKNSKGEDKYWIFYVNNQKAQKGVGQQLVNPGDRVEFKYKKPEW